MKTESRSFFSMLLLATSLPLNAHDKYGLLGPDATATDYYRVQCSNNGNGNAAKLEVAVKALKRKGPPLSLQVATEFPETIINLTDSNSKDKLPSRTVDVANDIDGKGNGFYFLAVNKTKAGIQSYHFEYHCLTASDVHTGTEISDVPWQNQ
ncbi:MULTISPECIES: hypothetical protein [Methylomonas]|uniref:hypothetical protein n=1 Tax=Methylomonas TaxID=416 RepID=UPI0012322931|nr:hypothetical protein [Methylomonas rhizoryzae]